MQRSAVPGASHPLSARQGRQDPRVEHFPPPRAHASHPSRLLHRRSGGPGSISRSCGRIARISCCIPLDPSRAASEGAAPVAPWPTAVARLFPRSPPAALGRCQAGNRHHRSRLRLLLRHGGLCDACKGRAPHPRHGGCRFREMDRLRRDRTLPGACRLGARGPHAARVRALRRRAFRSQPVRLGTRVAALRHAGTGNRAAHRLGRRTASISTISRRRTTFAPPFAGEGADLVFTGRMDYRPNIDAVQWFAREVLPVLRQRVPAARSVDRRRRAEQRGARACRSCPAFTSPDACPTPGPGSPPPTWWSRRCGSRAASRTSCWRRWRWQGRLSPRRKRSKACARMPGRDILLASGVDETVQMIAEVLDGRHATLGEAARRAVEAEHQWSVTLRPIDRLFDAAHAAAHTDRLGRVGMNVRALTEAGLTDVWRSGPAVAASIGLVALGLLFHTEVAAAVYVWSDVDSLQPLLPGYPDRALSAVGSARGPARRDRQTRCRWLRSPEFRWPWRGLWQSASASWKDASSLR